MKHANRVDLVLKDVVPIYVRPDTEDSNTLQNTAIFQLREQSDREVGSEGRHRLRNGMPYVKKVSNRPSASTPTSRFGRVVRQVRK